MGLSFYEVVKDCSYFIHTILYEIICKYFLPIWLVFSFYWQWFFFFVSIETTIDSHAVERSNTERSFIHFIKLYSNHCRDTVHSNSLVLFLNFPGNHVCVFSQFYTVLLCVGSWSHYHSQGPEQSHLSKDSSLPFYNHFLPTLTSHPDLCYPMICSLSKPLSF